MFGGIANRDGHEPIKRSIPILMYHRICDDPLEGVRRYTISPSVFAKQMEHLARAKYQVIGLDEVVRNYTGGGDLPKKPIVITFDDGYLDNYTYAYPALSRYGFKATIFLVGELVGGKAEWDAEMGDPVPDLMTWDHVLELAGRGIHFGAHTCTHPHLLQLPTQEARQQIARSKKIIEERLQAEVRYFAYPFRDYSQLLRKYVMESGYSAACCSEWGKSDRSDDLFMLKRLVILEHHNMAIFRWLVEDESSSPVPRILRGRRSALKRRIAKLLGRQRSSG